LELVSLFKWLKYFREKRLQENLSQSELLKRELKMIGMAILVIVGFIGLLSAIAWFISK